MSNPSANFYNGMQTAYHGYQSNPAIPNIPNQQNSQVSPINPGYSSGPIYSAFSIPGYEGGIKPHPLTSSGKSMPLMTSPDFVQMPIYGAYYAGFSNNPVYKVDISQTSENPTEKMQEIGFPRFKKEQEIPNMDNSKQEIQQEIKQEPNIQIKKTYIILI